MQEIFSILCPPFIPPNHYKHNVDMKVEASNFKIWLDLLLLSQEFVGRNFRGGLDPKDPDFGMPILHDQLRSCSITSLDSHFLQSRIGIAVLERCEQDANGFL